MSIGAFWARATPWAEWPGAEPNCIPERTQVLHCIGKAAVAFADVWQRPLGAIGKNRTSNLFSSCVCAVQNRPRRPNCTGMP